MTRNTSNNTFLTRVNGSNGSTTNWTMSLWVKFDDNDTGTHQTIFSTYPSGGVELRKLNSGQLNFYQYNGAYDWNIQPSADDFIITDFTQWYHIVCYYDRNGQSRLYVNGNLIGSATVSDNLYRFNQSGEPLDFGRIGQSSGSQYLSGSIAEVFFVDGLSLIPTTFAKTSNGSWVPHQSIVVSSSISGSGGFGTNGFYLPMKSSKTTINDFSYSGKSSQGGKFCSTLITGEYSGTNTRTASGGITPIVHTGEAKFNNASIMLASPDGVKPYGNCSVALQFGQIENLSSPYCRSWTIEYWAKKDDDTTPTSSAQLVSFNSTSGGDNVLLTRLNGGNNSKADNIDAYLLAAGGTGQTLVGTSAGAMSASADGWNHVIVHWSGARTILLVNGHFHSWDAEGTNIFYNNSELSADRTLGQLFNEADAAYGHPGPGAGNPGTGIIISGVRIFTGGFPYNSNWGARPTNILNYAASPKVLYSDEYDSNLQLAMPFESYSSNSNSDLTDYSTNSATTTNASSLGRRYSIVERAGAAYINGPFGSTSSTSDWNTPLTIDADVAGPTTAFNLSGGDFTIEGWFLSTRTSNYTNLIGWDNSCIVMIADWNSGGTTGLRVRRNYGTTSDVTFSVNTEYIQEWCHFSLSQSGNTLYAHINGELAGSTSAAVFNDLASGSGKDVRIGEMNTYTGWEPLNGAVSEVKVYKGYAKYGNSNFTPSTSTMLNTDGPVPVVIDDNYDNLSLYLPLRQIWDTDGTEYRYGEVDINDYSKYSHNLKGGKLISGFLPTPSGAMTTVGGTSTAVIDGANVTMGTDFTISFWYCRVRPISGTGGGTLQSILSSANYYTSGYDGNWVIRQHSDTELSFYSYNGTSDQQGGNLYIGPSEMGEWMHIVLYADGSRVRCTRDGNYSTNIVHSKSLTDQSNGIKIGYANSNNEGYFAISDLRIHNISSIANHDLSSLPAGRITNSNEFSRDGGSTYYYDYGVKTEFILDPSCDGVPTDLTGRTAPYLQGNASLSGDSKWRKSSYFFENGAIVLNPIDGNTVHPATDFTFECWVKFYKLNGVRQVIYGGDIGVSSEAHLFIEVNASNKIRVGASGGMNAQISTTNLSSGVWYHIAVVKDGSATQWKLYLNGTLDMTGTAPASNSDNDYFPMIGGLQFATDKALTGCIDSVRMTDGVEYTSNFTPGPISSITQKTVDGGSNYTSLTGTPQFCIAPDAENVGRDESTSQTVSNNGFSTVNSKGSSNVGGPQGDFATLNCLDGTTTGVDLFNGNLEIEPVSGNLGNNISSVPSTLGVTSGKWYAELILPDTSDNYSLFGVSSRQLKRSNDNQNGATAIGEITSNHRTTYSYESFSGNNTQIYYSNSNDGVLNGSGDISVSTENNGWDPPRNGNLVGIALDLDTNRIAIYKNGKMVFNGHVPYTLDSSGQRDTGMTDIWRFVAHPRYQTSQARSSQLWNFGQGFNASNHGFTDEESTGRFLTKPPKGHLALTGKNIYPEVRYYVKVSGGVFYLNNIQNPAITLESGFTYVFIQNDSTNSGHPLAFKDSGGNRLYTDITYYGEAGTVGSRVTVRVKDNSTIDRYYCTVHGNGMGNAVTLNEDTSGPTKFVKNPSNYFKTITYAGDGTASNSVTGLNFEPDFVWIKDFDSGYHILTDQVRGASYFISSNDTTAEGYDSNTQAAFQSFDANGFTVGDNASWFANRNVTGSSFSPHNYIAWSWNAGGTTVTNNDGTLASQVRANPACGFSIVEVNSTSSSNGTFGHGLGQQPELVLFKNLDSAYNWDVYMYTEGYSSTRILNQNTSSGRSALHAAPDDKTLPFTQSYTDNNTVAYCFHSVPGIQHIGKYVGNNNTDGSYVHCGFKPAFVMVKSLGSTNGNWVMYDSTRDEFNPRRNKFFADHNGAMNVSNPAGTSVNDNHIHFMANGFKLASNNTWTNNNGEDYFYIAIAESHHKFAVGG